MTACIFLFGLFYTIVTNFQSMVKDAEAGVAVTVLFDDGISQEQIDQIGQLIGAREEVDHYDYISADEAWDSFKTEYFGAEEALAEGFADDNPLAGSSSYEIRLNRIADQDGMVAYLEGLSGVRKVNYSNSAATGLESFNKILGLLFGVLIAMLLAVAVFLISNTISVAAQFRRRENMIMKMIGATNLMIRLPFLVEGVMLGLVGALIPLAGIYFIYEKAVRYVTSHFVSISTLFQPIPISTIYPQMVAVALGLGVGVGFIVSFVTIRKSLRV